MSKKLSDDLKVGPTGQEVNDLGQGDLRKHYDLQEYREVGKH